MPLELVHAAFAALNERRLDDYLDLYDDALVCHDLMHGPGWGRLAVAEQVQAMLAAFPDARLEVDLSPQMADQVVVHYTFSGTHQGALDGRAPTGKHLCFEGRMELRLAGDAVVERWSNLPIELKLQIAAAQQSS